MHGLLWYCRREMSGDGEQAASDKRPADRRRAPRRERDEREGDRRHGRCGGRGRGGDPEPGVEAGDEAEHPRARHRRDRGADHGRFARRRRSLPAERELAASLKVSRASVREAPRVLESLGVIRSSGGSGRGAGTFIASLPREALTRFLRLHVALTNFSVDEVIETRIQLERSSAALASAQASDDDLARLHATLAIMDTPGISLEVFNDADTDFHVAIAQATGNQLFSDLTGAIRDSLRRPILAPSAPSTTRPSSWPPCRPSTTRSAMRSPPGTPAAPRA